MNKLPESVMQAWKDREPAVVFSTVDKEGSPNSIYATCVEIFDNSIILVADNYFSKTRSNILSGTSGSILFISKDGKSFQVKGSVTYHTDGPLFDNMKKWNPAKHPGHAVAAISVEEVFSGSEVLV